MSDAEWHKDGQLLYTLTPTGKWNRGEPVMGNRLMVRVEGDPRYADASAVDALAAELLAHLNGSSLKNSTEGMVE